MFYVKTLWYSTGVLWVCVNYVYILECAALQVGRIGGNAQQTNLVKLIYTRGRKPFTRTHHNTIVVVCQLGSVIQQILMSLVHNCSVKHTHQAVFLIVPYQNIMYSEHLNFHQRLFVLVLLFNRIMTYKKTIHLTTYQLIDYLCYLHVLSFVTTSHTPVCWATLLFSITTCLTDSYSSYYILDNVSQRIMYLG